ncbi:hypothetical protein D3C71_990630 [compost metagenome]
MYLHMVLIGISAAAGLERRLQRYNTDQVFRVLRCQHQGHCGAHRPPDDNGGGAYHLLNKRRTPLLVAFACQQIRGTVPVAGWHRFTVKWKVDRIHAKLPSHFDIGHLSKILAAVCTGSVEEQDGHALPGYLVINLIFLPQYADSSILPLNLRN